MREGQQAEQLSKLDMSATEAAASKDEVDVCA
jgi:hypothetical protein